MQTNFIFQKDSDISLPSIIKFVVPTYLTSLLNTMYTIIDGIFVSGYAGTNALAAINIVYPLVNLLTGIALAFAAGGSSLAAISIGAGQKKDADLFFSSSILFAMLPGCLLALLILGNLTTVLTFLGATGATLKDCRIYALLWLSGTPAVIGKELLTCFIRIDGSPKWSFLVALSGGIVNIIFDFFLIVLLHMGIAGAGLATLLGLISSFLLGMFYIGTQSRHLQFGIQNAGFFPGIRCFCNGISEWIDQLAIAVTTVIFNRNALAFAGEDGIAAVSIVMYLQFLCLGVYFGYSRGIAPLLGYAYGNERKDICRRLEQNSYVFLAITSVFLYGFTFLAAPAGVSCFAKNGSPVHEIAVNGMRLYGLGFLFSGCNIFTAIRLSAYGKGTYSGILTFLRSFALLLTFLYLLPKLWGIHGIWLAVPAAEILTFPVCLWFSIHLRIQVHPVHF